MLIPLSRTLSPSLIAVIRELDLETGEDLNRFGVMLMQSDSEVKNTIEMIGFRFEGEFRFHLSFTLATSATLISLRYDWLPLVPFCLFFGLSSQGKLAWSFLGYL
ncbi:hypothetical protein E3N88_34448 [Mikania micrantha]|uniref:Uncharacterized protein n=1 Tax=Mikania micrantha TaxID=192012 RepID=A0A5N6LYB1_9ASTR|nr:hypothetical protein E3N88_34448 [Mikania micrantha]